jgi:hypothetical protein
MKYLLIVLALAGCTDFPSKVDTVYVPTYVPCVTHIAVKPDLSFEQEVRDIYYQVKALLADRLKMQEYEADLEAIVAGCTQEP